MIKILVAAAVLGVGLGHLSINVLAKSLIIEPPTVEKSAPPIYTAQSVTCTNESGETIYLKHVTYAPLKNGGHTISNKTVTELITTKSEFCLFKGIIYPSE